MKRLDRALCNSDWQLLFKDTNVFYLPRTSSDHHPILIDTFPSTSNRLNRPFWLETIWFSNPSFLNIIKDAWSSHPNNAILALKDFTKRVKVWNRDVFRNIFSKKRRLLARLNGIQATLCSKKSTFFLNLEKELASEYQQILSLEEEFWALKFRTEWTLSGDGKTKFFHLSTIYRRHQNKIWCL